MKKEINLFDVPRISSVQDMVLRSGREYKSKLALEDLNPTPISQVTYGELLENVLRFGKALQDIGVKEKTHIALIGENRVQWALSFLTCMSFNFVVVPIDKNLTQNEILNIVHESDAEAVIFSESFADIFSGTHLFLKKLKHYVCMDDCGSLNGFLSMKKMIINTKEYGKNYLPEINPNELAEIIFTSGSLGRAKGVMLSQKNLSSNLMDMLSMLFMYPEDRFLSVLPIHHTYECTCGMLCPLYSGSSIHYARSLKTVVDDIQKVKATIMLGVPLLYDKMYKRINKTVKEDKVKSVLVPALVKATNFAEKIGVKSKKKIFGEMHNKFGGHLRVFIAGGAAPDPQVAKGLREFGFNFIQGYGLTETSPIVALNRIDNFKDNAAGLPLPGLDIKINDTDENGNGEIWVKGNSVMLGYYKNENLTNEAFEDGWFMTGDVGFIDQDGFLHINGRKKNVIISKGGKNVFPEEIEDILNRSPFILESMVYGEKDKKQDEIIAVQIVVDAEAFIGMSQDKEIQITDVLMQKVVSEEVAKANKELAAHKQIRKFHIRDGEFEKTTTQKIKRYLVKKEEPEVREEGE